MIETIENLLQLAVSGFCMIFSFWHAAVGRQRLWLLTGFFFMLFFLGDLYWVLYLVLYGDMDYSTFIPDLCWYSAGFFLIVVLLYVRENGPKVRPLPLMWLIPAFTGGMCLFYMQWGAVISNLTAAVIMTVILWIAVGGLLAMRKLKDPDEIASVSRYRWLYRTAAAYCLLEYALWTASCFFERNTLLSPYLWIDVMMSALFLSVLPAMRKAVSA